MTQIFVGNLAYSTSESEVRTMFERYGRVASIRFPADMSTGRPRGFAFVSMRSSEDAEEAIARLNGAHLAGRAVTVNAAREDDNRGGAPRATSADRTKAMALLNMM